MNASRVRARAFVANSNFQLWLCYSWRPNRACDLRRKLHCSASRYQAEVPQYRPYYVTSPIFYVNAEPHAGHLYTLLLSDVLKRWEVLKGDKEAALLTGTDEHGMKVQKAAELASTPTKAFCDKNAQHFRDLAGAAKISYDRFIRTTDADHKVAVEHFWKELKSRGYIYESTHEGWYSVSDETFYPESQVHLILDPETGRKLYASKETGKEVEWTSELNYHFRLSAFRDRLLEHYEQHPDFIMPEQRMNFIKKEVEAGLKDLSVSRPSSRLQWGIPVPEDETQTIYVWLDALINYLTATGYPSGEGDKHKLWPPNAQVIGKDIVRFHCIYWPAFLMALDLPLPRGFLTHAHWTMGSFKMSKSLGNGVNPFYAIQRYGLDTIRYFMLHDGGIVDDSDYDNAFVVERYKKGLQDGLGNLLSRLLKSKVWTVGESVERAGTGKFNSEVSQPLNDFVIKINETAVSADLAMQKLNPRQALHRIMDLIYDANRFIAEAAPWELAKTNTVQSRELMFQIVFALAESLRISCILLQPFIPDKMQEALDELKVADNRRSFEDAKFLSDTTYGAQATEAILGRMSTKFKVRRRKEVYKNVLFPPLISEF